MMMKFTTTTLLFLLGSSFNSAEGSIRGGGKVSKNANGWVQHPTDARRRRMKMESTEDCLLVLKAIDYEDHQKDEDVWACEFQHDFAVDQFNGREFMDIDIPKEVIDELHPVSGASILVTKDAFVEESLDTKEMTLFIPEDGEIEVEQLDEDHERHYKQRRMKQQRSGLRSLADSNPGELNVLVVRVVDSSGSFGSSESQLVDDIFTDDFSLKTGYAQCSHDQLIMTPATGNSKITNGIITVNIDIEASAGQNALQNAAMEKASNELGGFTNEWDLVMFCQPPNGNWLAYAYINSWASFYNGLWCNRVSAQMHEIGHNLGLGHSNEPGESYGDQSSMMGYSYDIDDGPKMCFNAAKNYQLGWYERQKDSFLPLSNKNTVFDFVLNGVSEYKTSGDTEGKLITLLISGNGNRDYYVGFNDAYGVNSGTIEGRNKVLIFEKTEGTPTTYGESNRVAALRVGNSYTIPNFGGELDVTIKLNSITNGGRDANIEIKSGDDPLPVPPTDAPTVFDDVSIGSPPTAAPTPTPTCPSNSKDWIFKNRRGKKKKCSWIKTSTSVKQAITRCGKSYKGVRVRHACPKACAAWAGVGPCRSIIPMSEI